MTADPRAALDRLVAALEAHLQAAARRHGENDPGVVAAYTTLADAFESYDEALMDAYDEVTPLVLYDDVEDEREDDDEDDDDEDDDDEDDDDDDEDDEDEDDDGTPAGALDDEEDLGDDLEDDLSDELDENYEVERRRP